MHLGILETGRPSGDLAERYESYAQMAATLITSADPTATFRVYAVLDDAFPASVEECDGWIITGSAHGVYEELPWMLRTEDLIRQAAAHRRPVIGICFGHQIIAKAMGATVTKSPRGWGLGLHDYEVCATPSWMGEETPDRLSLHAVHQDQVQSLPPGATLIASSEFCPYAALAYGDHALSFQGHPEFSRDYETALLLTRSGTVFPEEQTQAALESMADANRSPSSPMVARWIARFLSLPRA